MAGYFIGGFFVGVKSKGKMVTWHIENIDGKRLESGRCEAEIAYTQILNALTRVQHPGYAANWGKSGAQDGSLR